MRTDKFHLRNFNYEIDNNFYFGDAVYVSRFASYVPCHRFDACETEDEQQKLLHRASYPIITEKNDDIIKHFNSLPKEHDINLSVYNIVPCIKFDDEDVEYFEKNISHRHGGSSGSDHIWFSNQRVARSAITDNTYYFLCFIGINISFKIDKHYINSLKLTEGNSFSLEATIFELVYNREELDDEPYFRLVFY